MPAAMHEPPSSQAAQSKLCCSRTLQRTSASEPKGSPKKYLFSAPSSTDRSGTTTSPLERRARRLNGKIAAWQRQHAVRSATQLAELYQLAARRSSKPLEAAPESKYRTAIPPYYFSLIDVDNPDDPIRIQSVPTSKEDSNISGVEFDDPLEEDRDSPVPGVTHRYPDRALLITTPVCSMYCRFW